MLEVKPIRNNALRKRSSFFICESDEKYGPKYRKAQGLLQMSFSLTNSPEKLEHNLFKTIYFLLYISSLFQENSFFETF